MGRPFYHIAPKMSSTLSSNSSKISGFLSLSLTLPSSNVQPTESFLDVTKPLASVRECGVLGLWVWAAPRGGSHVLCLYLCAVIRWCVHTQPRGKLKYSLGFGSHSMVGCACKALRWSPSSPSNSSTSMEGEVRDTIWFPAKEEAGFDAPVTNSLQ